MRAAPVLQGSAQVHFPSRPGLWPIFWHVDRRQCGLATAHCADKEAHQPAGGSPSCSASQLASAPLSFPPPLTGLACKPSALVQRPNRKGAALVADQVAAYANLIQGNDVAIDCQANGTCSVDIEDFPIKVLLPCTFGDCQSPQNPALVSSSEAPASGCSGVMGWKLCVQTSTQTAAVKRGHFFSCSNASPLHDRA